MRIVGVLVAAALVAGCGGKRTACSGSACLEVAGEYALSVTTQPGSITCKSISYDGSDPTTQAQFSGTLEVTQNASDLAITFTAHGFTVTEHGTLFDDNTASFTDHLPHVNVSDGQGNELDYTDDNEIDLDFAKAGDGISVTGSLRDSISANEQATGLDQGCILSAQLTGSSS